RPARAQMTRESKIECVMELSRAEPASPGATERGRTRRRARWLSRGREGFSPELSNSRLRYFSSREGFSVGHGVRGGQPGECAARRDGIPAAGHRPCRPPTRRVEVSRATGWNPRRCQGPPGWDAGRRALEEGLRRFPASEYLTQIVDR